MTALVLGVRDRLYAAWARLGRGDATLAPGPALGPDRWLCGAILGLVALGVVMVFSAGTAFAAKQYGDWLFFLKREAIYASLGLVVFAAAIRIDYSHYRRVVYPLLFLSLALLVAVLFFGTRVAGAIRWFRLGPLSFQPSELAKFALALYLAHLLARKRETVRAFSAGFLPPLAVTGVIMGLLLLEPNLGDAVIIGVTALALLFVAGTRTSYILLAVLLAAPIGWKFLIAGEPYRMKRMLAFLYPFELRRTFGYQLFESMVSVGSGGVAGLGLGQGRQKLFFLPEAHTDFILAVIGEELGFAGIIAVLLLFTVVVWRGYVAAARARDLYGSYLAFGIATLLGLSALVNMGVVLGLLPTKGLPLPFVSYGGTSLVVCLGMAGVLANISARNPEPGSIALFQRLRGRVLPSRNRRAEAGARVVVDTGRRRRPSQPALTPPPERDPPAADRPQG